MRVVEVEARYAMREELRQMFRVTLTFYDPRNVHLAASSPDGKKSRFASRDSEHVCEAA